MIEWKTFPQNLADIEIDRMNCNQCLFSGWFEEKIVINDQTRTFYTYLTPGLEADSRVLIVAPDDKQDPAAFIEKGNWSEFADQEKIFLVVMKPEGSWKPDGSDAAFMNKVYIAVQNRVNYVTIQDNIYAMGFGAGATIAQQAVMKMASEWSGLATFGAFSEELFAPLTTGTDVAKEHKQEQTELIVKGDTAPVPVWMFLPGKNTICQKVLTYWKKQNESAEEVFSNSYADEIYFPTTINRKRTINEEKIAQVRLTLHCSSEVSDEIRKAAWDYIKQACRHRSFERKALRNFKEPEAYGCVRKEMNCQGFKRVWYEYVPEKVKASGKPAPLVLCLHGRGSSMYNFVDLSGITIVAEERDFIAVIPEACVHQQRPNGIRNILLWSGWYKEEKIDDLSFLLQVTKDIQSRYVVDPQRIYACGQSSGGMMTTRLAMGAPEVFAACSPWSALKDPAELPPIPQPGAPRVPLMFLFGDVDWLCVDPEHGETELHLKHDLAETLRGIIASYELNPEPLRYNIGEISYLQYVNHKMVPMLVIGTVRNMSHANYPSESWIAYDEFMAKFSKREDGTLLYMGMEAY